MFCLLSSSLLACSLLNSDQFSRLSRCQAGTRSLFLDSSKHCIDPAAPPCLLLPPLQPPPLRHLLGSVYTLFPPKISTFWKVKFPVCHFCLLLRYFLVALRIHLRKMLWRWGREGSKALCRMAIPHKATVLPLAFENQICQQVDQVGDTAAVSCGFGIYLYRRIGKCEKFQIVKALFHIYLGSVD